MLVHAAQLIVDKLDDNLNFYPWKVDISIIFKFVYNEFPWHISTIDQQWSACMSTFQRMDVCFCNIHTAHDIQSCRNISKASGAGLFKQREGMYKVVWSSNIQPNLTGDESWRWLSVALFQIIVTKLTWSMCKYKALNAGGS